MATQQISPEVETDSTDNTPALNDEAVVDLDVDELVQLIGAELGFDPPAAEESEAPEGADDTDVDDTAAASEEDVPATLDAPDEGNDPDWTPDEGGEPESGQSMEGRLRELAEAIGVDPSLGFDDLVAAAKEAAMRRSDYDRKTAELADLRRQHETAIAVYDLLLNDPEEVLRIAAELTEGGDVNEVLANVRPQRNNVSDPEPAPAPEQKPQLSKEDLVAAVKEILGEDLEVLREIRAQQEAAAALEEARQILRAEDPDLDDEYIEKVIARARKEGFEYVSQLPYVLAKMRLEEADKKDTRTRVRQSAPGRSVSTAATTAAKPTVKTPEEAVLAALEKGGL